MTALSGIRVVDLSRLAPGPLCSMMLADFGAEVILVEPVKAPDGAGEVAYNALQRNKRAIRIDLKNDQGHGVFCALARRADVLIEGFRPGVVERLGISYEHLRSINERIIYCSLTGYGQHGPYAHLAGHDLNYAALGGALGMIGRADGPPAPPMNLVADYGGGGLVAAFGIMTALFARERTGRGQKIDAAMTDGVLALLTKLVGQHQTAGPGRASPERGRHRLNGGLPYYDVYECADGRWISVAALEERFYAALCEAMGLGNLADARDDPSRWETLRKKLRRGFAERPLAEWMHDLAEHDACAAPVLSLEEALELPHHREREMIIELTDPTHGPVLTIAPVPKLGLTPGSVRTAPPRPGEHTDAILAELGYDAERIAQLRRDAVVA